MDTLQSLNAKLDMRSFKPSNLDRAMASMMLREFNEREEFRKHPERGMVYAFLSGVCYGRTKFTQKELKLLKESYSELIKLFEQPLPNEA